MQAVLDAAGEVQASEVHAHDEATLAEGLWLSCKDGDSALGSARASAIRDLKCDGREGTTSRLNQ